VLLVLPLEPAFRDPECGGGFPARAAAPRQPQGATKCHPLRRDGDRRPFAMRTFLKILSGNDPKYDSDNIDCYAPPRMCYHIDGEDPIEEAPELTPLDKSPRSHANYLREKVACLQGL
jgi:hypothetical protein